MGGGRAVEIIDRDGKTEPFNGKRLRPDRCWNGRPAARGADNSVVAAYMRCLLDLSETSVGRYGRQRRVGSVGRQPLATKKQTQPWC